MILSRDAAERAITRGLELGVVEPTRDAQRGFIADLGGRYNADSDLKVSLLSAAAVAAPICAVYSISPNESGPLVVIAALSASGPIDSLPAAISYATSATRILLSIRARDGTDPSFRELFEFCQGSMIPCLGGPAYLAGLRSDPAASEMFLDRAAKLLSLLLLARDVATFELRRQI